MSRLLIIGYGNPLRGDDGFGWQAASQLLDRIADPEIEVMAVQQLTPELMEPISRAGRVVFIDAAASGEPGVLEERTLAPDTAFDSHNFTHHSTPGGLLAGAQALFGRAPEATLYTVPGEDFGFGERLTPAVEKALAEVVARVCAAALYGAP
jgi:hydrogenase maturation protease